MIWKKVMSYYNFESTDSYCKQYCCGMLYFTIEDLCCISMIVVEANNP